MRKHSISLTLIFSALLAATAVAQDTANKRGVPSDTDTSSATTGTVGIDNTGDTDSTTGEAGEWGTGTDMGTGITGEPSPPEQPGFTPEESERSGEAGMTQEQEAEESALDSGAPGEMGTENLGEYPATGDEAGTAAIGEDPALNEEAGEEKTIPHQGSVFPEKPENKTGADQ